MGLSSLSGHALFGWIWSVWLPQPYENITLRLMACLIGSSLMTRWITQDPSARRTQWVFGLVIWLELPVLFSWMYFCNSGNAVWLASVTAMVLIYYQSTDWRLATAGLIAGALLSWSLFQFFGPAVPSISPHELAVHAVVLVFAWSLALVLNLSSADLRREHVSHTLTTIGIMAHELRTPLSTAALIGEAIQMEMQRQPDQPGAQQLDKLAMRLHALVRNMNHQIDTQIANAKLLQLPSRIEPVSAAQLVTQVRESYPYPSKRQSECVKVQIHDDFIFHGCATQFSQVLNNLFKNALHALMAADSPFPPGALLIEVGLGQQGQRGHIVVTDEGTGIDAALLPQIFKPFFSSNCNPGHGLGLAFCQQVVHSAGGSIQVKSKASLGAMFTIELPLAH